MHIFMSDPGRADRKRLTVVTTPERAEQIKRTAKSEGLTYTRYINRLVADDLGRRKEATGGSTPPSEPGSCGP